MTPQDELDRILARAPKREEFPTEEEYREAVDGFRHRAGPTIRILRQQISLAQSKSQDTAK